MMHMGLVHGGAYPPPVMPPPVPVSIANQEAKLFVGGLTAHVDEQALKAVFETYGEVDNVVMLSSRGTSGQKCAFVIMKSMEAANAALVLSQVHKMLPSDPEPIVVRFADRGGQKRKRD